MSERRLSTFDRSPPVGDSDVLPSPPLASQLTGKHIYAITYYEGVNGTVLALGEPPHDPRLGWSRTLPDVFVLSPHVGYRPGRLLESVPPGTEVFNYKKIPPKS
jgi:hypothetical protein